MECHAVNIVTKSFLLNCILHCNLNLGKKKDINKNTFIIWCYNFLKGLARTQIPTNINYAIEFPTFGEIAGVNPTGVQWKGLALEEPPS